MSEIENFRDLEIPEDTTADQEFRIFQAYLAHVDFLNDRQTRILDDQKQFKPQGSEDFFFQKLTWPILIVQYDFEIRVDPYYHGLRTLSLLSELSKQVETRQYVQHFLATSKRKNYLNYVFDIIGLIQLRLAPPTDLPTRFTPFVIAGNEDFAIILDFLCIDYTVVSTNSKLRADYLALREKPLFKLSDNRYLVLNWNYLANKIYTGLLFDFYHRSGIKSKYAGFDRFKSEIISRVSEQVTFNALLKKAVTQGRNVVHFDVGNEDGIPDCYVRQGKYVFLFEFKDTWIPSPVVESADYNVIAQDITEKFIRNKRNESKGILQLLNHVSILNSGGFSFDVLAEKKLKVKNVVVYPILVYTHSMLSMPGINSYLSTQMQQELEQQKRPHDSVSINDLVMIDLEFFFNYFVEIENKSLNFKQLIDSYLSQLQKARITNRKNPTPEGGLKANLSFDGSYRSLLSSKNKNFRRAQVNELFKIFAFTEPT